MSSKLKIAALTATLAVALGATPAAAQTSLTLWTAEGEAEGAFQFVEGLAQQYMEANPDVSITVVNKQVEALREDFLTSSLAGGAPDILWTVADHVGPFTASFTIAPLDDLIDLGVFVPAALAAVQADGQTWGAPVSFGNHLMLYWNKDIIAEAPADSDAMIAAAAAATDQASNKFGLTFNQTESFWLIPFLGGFGGSVFAEDGVTPTLDTEAMVNALTFMHDLKYKHGLMPAESDYAVSDGLFKQGDAAMIVNGDWALGEYINTWGESLGVGPLPQIVGYEMPKPYIAGKFLMVSEAAAADEAKAPVVADFIDWVTNKDNQLAQVETLSRLPANAEAINDPMVTDDPFLAGSALAVQEGVPQPTNLEMRCVFDSMTAGVRDLFASANADPAAIAATMQASADAGVAPGGECAPE